MPRSRRCCSTSQDEFPVVDADGTPLGMLGRDEIIRALQQLGPTAPVSASDGRRDSDRQPQPASRRGV